MILHAELSRFGTITNAGASLPIERAQALRSHTVDFTAGEALLPADFLADLTPGVETLTVYSDASAWISIGPSPDTSDEESRRFLPAGVRRFFYFKPGDRVAVAPSAITSPSTGGGGGGGSGQDDVARAEAKRANDTNEVQTQRLDDTDTILNGDSDADPTSWESTGLIALALTANETAENSVGEIADLKQRADTVEQAIDEINDPATGILAQASGQNDAALARIEDLETAVTDPTTGLAAQKTRADGIRTDVNELDVQINQSGTGLAAMLSSLGTGIYGPGGIDERTDQVETDLNTPTTGVKAVLAYVYDQLNHATTGVVAMLQKVYDEVFTANTGLKAVQARIVSDLDTANTGIKAVLARVVSDLDTANTGIKARLSTNTQNISNLQSQVNGLTQVTGTEFLGKVAYNSDMSNVDLQSIIPAGTTEIEIELIGGGASGVAYGHAVAAGSMLAVAHGGFAGSKLNSGEAGQRIPYSAGQKFSVSIGLGGPGQVVATPGSTASILQAAGGDTVGTLTASDGSVIWTGRAKGGLSYTSYFGFESDTSAIAKLMGYLGVPITGLAGHGGAYASPWTDITCTAQEVVDAPSSGGGARGASSVTDSAGSGGRIRNRRSAKRPALPSYVEGGAGASGGTPGADGRNPFPGEAGSYGSGAGGGTTRGGNGQQKGGNGAAPGGGGGGGISQGSGSDVAARSGSGGQGAGWIFFFGIKPR